MRYWLNRYDRYIVSKQYFNPPFKFYWRFHFRTKQNKTTLMNIRIFFIEFLFSCICESNNFSYFSLYMNSFEFDIKTDQSAIPREGNIKKNLQTHWISLKINSTNDVTLQNKYMHPLNSSLYYLILRVKWILSMHQKTQPPWFFNASLIVPGTCINYRTCSSMYTLFTRKLWLPYKKHQIAYIKWKIFFLHHNYSLSFEHWQCCLLVSYFLRVVY